MTPCVERSAAARRCSGMKSGTETIMAKATTTVIEGWGGLGVEGFGGLR